MLLETSEFLMIFFLSFSLSLLNRNRARAAFMIDFNFIFLEKYIASNDLEYNYDYM